MESEIYRDNMTDAELYQAGSYYYGLGFVSPKSWGLHSDFCLDIPLRYRSIVNYRTTLGHKVNHKFDEEANCEFFVVKHPLFGVIVGLVATKEIRRGEELFADYLYSPQYGANWYREAERRYLNKVKSQNE